MRLLGTCRSDSRLRLLRTASSVRRLLRARLGMLCLSSSESKHSLSPLPLL